MQHTGYLSRAPWHGLEELMDSMPETIFRDFIKVPILSGRAYQPGETDVKLPKSFRQLGSCEECGRLAMEGCYAMGSLMQTESGDQDDWYIACLHCSVYQAIEQFLDSEPNWFQMMEIDGMVSLNSCLHFFLNVCQILQSTVATRPVAVVWHRLAIWLAALSLAMHLQHFWFCLSAFCVCVLIVEEQSMVCT